MTSLDRWIIGGLVMALTGILWFLLLDARAEISRLVSIVNTNGNRITALEQRALWQEKLQFELRDELKHHPMSMEKP